MNPHLLPAQLRDDARAWTQTVVAFVAEEERRSSSRRTVEGYARMFWPFFERVARGRQRTTVDGATTGGDGRGERLSPHMNDLLGTVRLAPRPADEAVTHVA